MWRELSAQIDSAGVFLKRSRFMQRLTINLAVALLTFSFGVLIWQGNPVQLIQSHSSEPLRRTLSQERKPANAKVTFDHYKVIVENVSLKTIHGYSLGWTCNCRGEGTYGRYPEGITFSNPAPTSQLLKPGEIRTEILPAWDLPVEQLKVWADLVHFADGSNWGPNQSRTEGYVRALE
jgi:hypothetical protein